MPVVKDGMPGTDKFLDIIWNAIKIRLWAEKTGSKAGKAFSGSDQNQVGDTTFVNLSGYRLNGNDTTYDVNDEPIWWPGKND